MSLESQWFYNKVNLINSINSLNMLSLLYWFNTANTNVFQLIPLVFLTLMLLLLMDWLQKFPACKSLGSDTESNIPTPHVLERLASVLHILLLEPPSFVQCSVRVWSVRVCSILFLVSLGIWVAVSLYRFCFVLFFLENDLNWKASLNLQMGLDSVFLTEHDWSKDCPGCLWWCRITEDWGVVLDVLWKAVQISNECPLQHAVRAVFLWCAPQQSSSSPPADPRNLPCNRVGNRDCFAVCFQLFSLLLSWFVLAFWFLLQLPFYVTVTSITKP